MRYRLFIKDHAQLESFTLDNIDPKSQMIAIQFSHDDISIVRSAAKILRSLHSNTDIVIYDSEQGRKVIG